MSLEIDKIQGSRCDYADWQVTISGLLVEEVEEGGLRYLYNRWGRMYIS